MIDPWRGDDFYIDGDKCYLRQDAAIRIFKGLVDTHPDKQLLSLALDVLARAITGL